MSELEEKTSGSKIALCGIILVIFSYLLVIVSALHSADKPVGGGDTWVAMACGRYTVGPWAKNDFDRTIQMKILDLFGIHVTWKDPFSANSRPYRKGIEDCEGWVNQNWLSHVMFYKLNMAFGENSIVVYKFIQAILTALFAFWAARALKVNYFLAAICASFGVLLARSFIDMRPNISTILMAAIMFQILFRWKAGHPKSMLWLLPVMIIWSNVHGGFIYGIVVMGVACGGYAASNIMAEINPNLFYKCDWKKDYLWLLIGFAITVLTPMIFSPFGTENLIHPLMVMMGKDGSKWRQVSEWHPLFSDGFGNVKPYIVFASIFLFISLIWIVIRIMYRPDETSCNSEEKKPDIIDFDFAWFGIIAGTLKMSVDSRRFVFLAAVVLAPFMAILIQQIFVMTAQMWKKLFKPKLIEQFEAGLAILSTAALTIILYMAVQDIYVRPPADGIERTVFRHMVGINDQPVRAMPFFDANHISGVVLNEWTNGGIVPWGQTPDEKTGAPACKVFMDGRAQAAYRISHFEKWQFMNINFPSASNEMQRRQKMLDQLISSTRLSKNSSRLYDKLIDTYGEGKTYFNLLLAMAVDYNLYGKILEHEGINVVLAKNARSQRTIEYLRKNDNWKILYMDESFTLIFRVDSPENKELFDKPVEELVYPDELSRTLSLAHYYLNNRLNNNTEFYNNIVKADKLLATVDDQYIKAALPLIFQSKSMLRKQDEFKDILDNHYERLKKLVDDEVDLGRLSNLETLAAICQYQSTIARSNKDNDRAKFYNDMYLTYAEKLREKIDRENSKLFW